MLFKVRGSSDVDRFSVLPEVGVERVGLGLGLGGCVI